MPSQSVSRVTIWLVSAIAIIAVDQYTKLLASQYLLYSEPVPVVPFLNMTLLHNTGAAFSLLASASGWQRWFFIGLGAIVSIGLVIWMSRLGKDERSTGWALALILGGAIGNVIDRVAHGYVIDFIDVYVGDYHWPAFNVADSAICVGVVILVSISIFGSDSQNGNSEDRNSASA